MKTNSQLVRESFESGYAGKKTADYNYKIIYRERLIEYRRSKESIVKLVKPTNLPRARSLGYKAKKGFVTVRVRIRKGSGMHKKPKRARRPKRMGVKKLTRVLSIQSMAEKRANKKHPNCEVLNSYWVGEDGRSKYYEILLVDITRPEILKDKEINWIAKPKHTNRAERGKTSAQKKSRGLGKGINKKKRLSSYRLKKKKSK